MPFNCCGGSRHFLCVSGASSTTPARSPTSSLHIRRSQGRLPRIADRPRSGARGQVSEVWYGGLVGFEPKGGEKAALGFIDRLKLFYHLANIGDARSLAIHPSSTTRGQLNPEQQAAAGVSPAFVPLSIGVEDPNDIIADIAHALDGV